MGEETKEKIEVALEVDGRKAKPIVMPKFEPSQTYRCDMVSYYHGQVSFSGGVSAPYDIAISIVRLKSKEEEGGMEVEHAGP